MELLTPLYILLLLVAGVFSGLAAGLMGVGGGLINVPALYYVFQAAGYPQDTCFHMALGTSLAIIVFTSSSSARTHNEHNNVLWRVALIAGFGGILGSLGASFTAVTLSDTLLKKAFAVVMYLAALRMMTRKQPAIQEDLVMRTETWRLLIIGLASGVFAGFFGIGGGLVGVPLFMMWANLSPHQSVGSSSAMVVILGLFGALGYALSTPPQHLAYNLGYVNIPGWILIACSSILAAHFGAKIAAKTKPKTLTIIFACGLILVGTKMLLD